MPIQVGMIAGNTNARLTCTTPLYYSNQLYGVGISYVESNISIIIGNITIYFSARIFTETSQSSFMLDGILGLGLNANYDMRHLVRLMGLDEMVAISSMSGNISFGSISYPGVDDENIVWRSSNSEGWSIEVQQLLSNKFNLPKANLSLTNKFMSLSKSIYNAVALPFLSQNNCNLKENDTMFYHCSNVSEQNYYKMPSFTLAIANINVTVNMIDLISNISSKEYAIGKSHVNIYEFDIQILQSEREEIQIPLQWICSQYVVFLDYNNSMLGIAKIRTDWNKLILLLVALLIGLMVIIYICENGKVHLD